MSNYTVYIDEAGDLGVNRGTQWFVLTAVVVAKNDEPQIRKNLAKIKERLNVHEVHLRKIQDYNKRSYIVHELNGENFVYMNVLVDTNKFDQAKIPDAATAYNYVCKYLLQRVSWYLESIEGVADIALIFRLE